MVNEWGSDAARMYILSKCHPSETLTWDGSSSKGVIGMVRFLNKVKKICTRLEKEESLIPSKTDVESIETERRKTIELYTNAMEKRAFHNALSYLMKFTTVLQKTKNLSGCQEAVYDLIMMLYPFATETCQELVGSFFTQDSETFLSISRK